MPDAAAIFAPLRPLGLSVGPAHGASAPFALVGSRDFRQRLTTYPPHDAVLSIEHEVEAGAEEPVLQLRWSASS